MTLTLFSRWVHNTTALIFDINFPITRQGDILKFTTKRSVATTRALMSAVISTQLIAGQVHAQTESAGAVERRQEVQARAAGCSWWCGGAAGAAGAAGAGAAGAGAAAVQPALRERLQAQVSAVGAAIAGAGVVGVIGAAVVAAAVVNEVTDDDPEPQPEPEPEPQNRNPNLSLNLNLSRT